MKKKLALTILATVALAAASPTSLLTGFAQEDADDKVETIIRSIEKLDDGLNELIDTEAQIEQLSEGHRWTEGPVWNQAKKQLFFCDIPNNRINCWEPKSGQTSIYMEPSGYDGPKSERSREPGTNGLIFDPQGRLIACDHGNRRIYRLNEDGSKTTLVDRFEGKRFNSPNDLVMDNAGNIFFTDPPYGMLNESVRELQWHGVYRLTPEGTVSLLTKEFTRPNGIGLSPDEKTLYVAQSDKNLPVIKSFGVNDDGTIGNSQVLYDAKHLMDDPGFPDGMAVDQQGNLWATGPGGVLIISPAGKLLGRIMMNKPTANCAFGDDGSTLYITSSDFLCRVKTKTRGLGFAKNSE